jgi:integrase
VISGYGLRASEVAALKVGDVDGKRITMRIEQGNGANGGYDVLSPVSLQWLHTWWRVAHLGQHARGCLAVSGLEPRRAFERTATEPRRA